MARWQRSATSEIVRRPYRNPSGLFERMASWYSRSSALTQPAEFSR